ncbi:MAG: hypothetical protein KDA86_17700 [Planctomycetaceae bacterium]|nr:hypothetical protein [Planctomycetaceae bacterium]
MNVESLTIEYEHTAEDAQKIYKRAMEQLRLTTFGQAASGMRWAAVGSSLLIAAFAWRYGKVFDSVLFAAIGVWVFLIPNLTHLIAGWFMTSSWSTRIPRTLHVRIDIDKVGALLRYTRENGSKRYWWSKLSSVVETQYGIELNFDNHQISGLIIPWKALQQSAQRDQLMQRIDDHFPYRTKLATDTVS